MGLPRQPEDHLCPANNNAADTILSEPTHIDTSTHLSKLSVFAPARIIAHVTANKLVEKIDRGHAWFEIFFDLVFVAVCFRLGGQFKSLDGTFGVCFLTLSVYFIPLYNVWWRTTDYFNRFKHVDIASQVAEWLLVTSLVFLSLYTELRAMNGPHESTHELVHFSFYTACWAIAFVQFFLVRATVPPARAHCTSAMTALAFNLCCHAVALATPIEAKGVLWFLAFIVESKACRYSTHKQQQQQQQQQEEKKEDEEVGVCRWLTQCCTVANADLLPVDVEHLAARHGEFVMVVLGEGVLRYVRRDHPCNPQALLVLYGCPPLSLWLPSSTNATATTTIYYFY